VEVNNPLPPHRLVSSYLIYQITMYSNNNSKSNFNTATSTVTLMVNDLVEHLRPVACENWKPIVHQLKGQWQKRLKTRNDIKDFKALWSEAKKKASSIITASSKSNNPNKHQQHQTRRDSLGKSSTKDHQKSFHPQLMAQVKEDILKTSFAASRHGLTDDLKWTMAISKESWRHRLLQKREELAKHAGSFEINDDTDLRLENIPSPSSFDDFWNQVITTLAPTLDLPDASPLLEKDLPDMIFEAVLPAVIAKVHHQGQQHPSFLELHFLHLLVLCWMNYWIPNGSNSSCYLLNLNGGKSAVEIVVVAVIRRPLQTKSSWSGSRRSGNKSNIGCN
jgi:hypothetical protein